LTHPGIAALFNKEENYGVSLKILNKIKKEKQGYIRNFHSPLLNIIEVWRGKSIREGRKGGKKGKEGKEARR
jgi:hypothetical protein